MVLKFEAAGSSTVTSNPGLDGISATREVLARDTVTVETPYGPAGVKIGRRHGRVVNVAPEFEEDDACGS